MKKFDYVLLVVFLVALVGLGILVPSYLCYWMIVLKGFWSIPALGAMAINAFTSYNVLNFLKENWKK